MGRPNPPNRLPHRRGGSTGREVRVGLEGVHVEAEHVVPRRDPHPTHHRREVGQPSPTGDDLVRSTLSGIRRDYAAAGDRPRTPRTPLLVDDIVTIVAAARREVEGWAEEVLERRDSALLLMGFASAFRRSELVALTCGDVTINRLDGAHVRLRRSKTDQEGRGSVRALPFTTSHTSCPPCAYLRWVQVVAAFDTGGRPAVIRLLRGAGPFEAHVCRGVQPRTDRQAPLLRSIRKNGNLSSTALSGAAVHAAIRRRAERASLRPAGRLPARRAFAAGGVRHSGVPQRRVRARDHAPDRAHHSGHARGVRP